MTVNKLFADIPDALQPLVANARERFAENPDWPLISTRDPQIEALLPRIVACSDYVTDVLARYPHALAELIDDGRIQRSLAADELESLYLATANATAAESEAACVERLRRFRHRELLRIAFRDVMSWAVPAETLRDLSALADTCIRAALQYTSAELQERYGVPRSEDGTESVFIVIAMGKLGGSELNFSSDIDLVFLYSEPGETDGARSLTNEEYFRRLAQLFINLLSQKTADGFVYRVDTRLRPFGDSGPLAVSVAALEDYLVQHGRDWERYAWVKARAVNVWAGICDFSHQVLRPFVYRRYLDYGVFASLREMKAMIEREGRAAANRENIKLGNGGIREIEFMVQTLQLVRGGTLKSLRQRSLLPALQQLGEQQLMSIETVAELTESYLFLRTLENRLQAIADRQIHELPDDPIDRARLALAMDCADWPALYARLGHHRLRVQTHFDQILRHDREGNGAAEAEDNAALTENSEAACAELKELGFTEPLKVGERLTSLRASAQYTRMQELGRRRLERLLPAVLRACAVVPSPIVALDGALRVLESVGRRSAYIALLHENEQALKRLVWLCSSSDFLARQVTAHPLLLDELLDPRIFREAPDREHFEQDIAQRLSMTDAEDSEQQFEALRNFQQAAVFRVAVADLSGTLPLMKVSDRLTDIAELVLENALSLSLAELAMRHGMPRCEVNGVRRPAGFAIAGYGKLGGLELGYGSDLDIVFLHDSAGEHQETDGEKPLENAVFFARLARRVTHILTMPTPTGPLYEVDTRLRPSGNSGLLVTSLAALDRYQREDAWTWEHQALLRARAVAGDREVRAAFEALRSNALLRYVRRDSLRDEVIRMRARMRAELNKSTDELFDLKQGEGGIIDIEFLVQYLILRDASVDQALLAWSDNIRQLEALGHAAILPPADAEMLAETYRAYRTRMHLKALAGEPGLVKAESFMKERELVQRLWKMYLGDG